jgi:hypothetical protein
MKKLIKSDLESHNLGLYPINKMFQTSFTHELIYNKTHLIKLT